MNFLSRQIRAIATFSIISIVALSFVLLFYIQGITEHSIRNNLFDQQKERQLESTRTISEHIGSDINLVIDMLDGLANSLYLQQGHLFGAETEKLVHEKYDQFSNSVSSPTHAVINRLFVLDKNNIITIGLAPAGIESFVGDDFSDRDWVKQTRSKLTTVFSSDFEQQGVYRIFISHPIINRHTHEYIGMVGASIPTIPFFEHYGNMELSPSQLMVAYDRNGTILDNSEDERAVGNEFFGDYVQRLISHNQILDNITRNLLAGKIGYAVYNYGQGERLTNGYPISVQGKPVYFIQVTIPTAEIYSPVHDILFTERLKMYSLLGGTMASIAVLIVFLIKWNNTLNEEVKRRTKELFESERRTKELEGEYDDMKQYLNVVLEELHERRSSGR
jgi:hypothetical protein